MTNCSLWKDELTKHFAAEIEVAEVRGRCVLTLPTKTLDNRYPEIYIEQIAEDSFLVHDGGKTASELYAQGIHLTELREDHLMELAKRNDVVFADGKFQAICNRKRLQETIFAIGQCASLGMWFVVGQKPAFADVPVLKRVEAGAKTWSKTADKELRERVQAKGRKASHVFDFALFPRLNSNAKVIGVKVLRPGDNSLSKAREYGFMVYDLESTMFENWLRMVVMARSDQWTKDAKNLVYKLSQDALEVGTGHELEIEQDLPIRLAQIAA